MFKLGESVNFYVERFKLWFQCSFQYNVNSRIAQNLFYLLIRDITVLKFVYPLCLLCLSNQIRFILLSSVRKNIFMLQYWLKYIFFNLISRRDSHPERNQWYSCVSNAVEKTKMLGKLVCMKLIEENSCDWMNRVRKRIYGFLWHAVTSIVGDPAVQYSETRIGAGNERSRLDTLSIRLIYDFCNELRTGNKSFSC